MCVSSVVVIGGGGVYVLFCNDVWVCADVCFVSSVVDCGLFIEIGSVLVHCLFV